MRLPPHPSLTDRSRPSIAYSPCPTSPGRGGAIQSSGSPDSLGRPSRASGWRSRHVGRAGTEGQAPGDLLLAPCLRRDPGRNEAPKRETAPRIHDQQGKTTMGQSARGKRWVVSGVPSRHRTTGRCIRRQHIQTPASCQERTPSLEAHWGRLIPFPGTARQRGRQARARPSRSSRRRLTSGHSSSMTL